MKPDYYRVLGVASEASPAQIRQAYRALARREHPDRRPARSRSVAAAMALLNEAFETLGDRERRKRYDLARRVPEPPEVLEAILSAARAALGTGLGGSGGVSGDLVIANRGLRATVRFAPFLGCDGLRAWLRSAHPPTRGEAGLAVILACRVLDPEQAAFELSAVRFEAVAIDLIEARLFGRLPYGGAAELFGVFLGREKQRA